MPTVLRNPRKVPAPLLPEYPPTPVRRFTVDEYHRLIETGILKSGDPYELIRGWIVPKIPISPTHSTVVRLLDKRLQRLVGDAIVVSVQQPITTDDSEPEPDLTLSAGPQTRYYSIHPTPAEVYLVIEVSDSSLEFDRSMKLNLYARSKIPTYWIVNIPERRVEVYTQPRGGKNPTYRTLAEYSNTQSVPVVIAGQALGEIPVSELLP